MAQLKDWYVGDQGSSSSKHDKLIPEWVRIQGFAY